MNNADRQRNRAILLLAGAGFCSAVSLRVCDPLIPQLSRSFDVSTGQAAQTITAFAVAYGLLQLVYGVLGDRFGKYALITVAAFACAVASIGAALAPTMGWLIALRAVAGATAAGIIPLSMAWLGDTVPYASRQTALARMLTGTIGGMMAGLLLGGIFADTVGWRWVFVLLSGLFLLIGFGLAAELRGNPVTRAPPGQQTGRLGLAEATASIRHVLHIPWARVILLVVFLEGLLVFGAVSFFPTYLHHRFNLSLSFAGALVALFGVGGLLYAVLVTRLVRTLREQGIAIAGGLSLGVAIAALLLGPAWPVAAAGVLLAGLGFYMLHNTLQTNATQMAPDTRGVALAIFASALFFGQSVGVGIAGALYDTAGPALVFATAALTLPLIGLGFGRALRARPQQT